MKGGILNEINNNKIELTVNNRKYLTNYIEQYKKAGKLPKKIELDQKLVYKFNNIQDYFLIAILKEKLDPIDFEFMLEIQKIKLK